MTKYIIIHNKHEGCYDYKCYEDEESKIRLTSITINPPKIFMFTNRDEAQDFFEDYINDVDVTDVRCKKGEEIEHNKYCTCGIIEMDDDDNPILFYNKKNQIFLLEEGPKVFTPPGELKCDIKNFNLTNKILRRCKTLSKEQKDRYIELGKYCQDCTSADIEDEENIKVQNNVTTEKSSKMLQNLETSGETSITNEIISILGNDIKKENYQEKVSSSKKEKVQSKKAPRKKATAPKKIVNSKTLVSEVTIDNADTSDED